MTTDDIYLEIKIAIPDTHQEMLISELIELDFSGFDQYDDYLLAYIPQRNYNDVAREYVESWLSAQSVACTYEQETVYEPKNWNEEWEKTIQPMQVGQFYVRPTWTPTPTPEGLYLLEIDPKMAFGTGYHETTRCMLRMLPNVVKKGQKVLDIGTVTGILAIAALKLGARNAFGFDIDEWSAVNATENALINEVSDLFEIREGSFETLPERAAFELVLANVNRNMLLDMAPAITACVATGGDLLLSGLLISDEDAIRSNKSYAALRLHDRIQENEWICLHYRKDPE